MFKRKHLILGMTALLSLTALVGCSDKEGDSASGDKVELKVMLTPQWKGVIDATEEGADYDSFFKHAAERFEAEHENVDITVEVVAGDQRDELLNVNLNGGTPPDIFFESVFAMFIVGPMAKITSSSGFSRTDRTRKSAASLLSQSSSGSTEVK